MNIPKHVAIIMDGNGRWATKRNLSRSIGHLEGSKTLKKIVEYAFSNGIEILSVFAFSTENFKRSKEEVNYLMNLFVKMFKDYFDELNEKGIKNIHFLGKKSNPYKYLKKSSAFVLSSVREGYPVVFIEAMILNIPIITTDVSDAKEDIDGKFGIVVKNDDESIYKGMKKSK